MSGPVSRRFAWADLTPFPDNPPISMRRIARLRREHGGYNHGIVNAPVIADNTALAFPEFPEDTLFILDGNNRREIARLEGKLDEEFIGLLWRGLSLAEMHEKCLGGNDRRTTKPAEEFLRRVRMGDARRKAIKETVEELGWSVTYERAEAGLSCTDELEWIWAGGKRPGLNDKAHRLAVVRAIETYEGAFGRKAQSRQGNVIKGLGAFWLLYPDADLDALVKALDDVDVKKLYDLARARRADLRLTHLFNGFVDVLRLRYSKGRRSGRLKERRIGAGGVGSWSEA